MYLQDPSQQAKAQQVIISNQEGAYSEFEEILADSSIKIIKAADEKEIFEILKLKGNQVSSIVLDWGDKSNEQIEFLKSLQFKPKWQHIPVITLVKTIKKEDLVESVNAGAYYYLEKPYPNEIFSSVLNKAIKDHTNYIFYLEKAQNVNISSLIQSGEFKYQTFKEGYEIADWLASLCRHNARDDIVVGFIELLINAVEHGNLNIGYDEKTDLMKAGNYIKHVLERISLPEYKDKYVHVEFSKTAEKLTVIITDQGKGFNFEKYLELDKARLFHSHGKGLIMARKLYFDHLEFTPPGNKVTVTINLKNPAE